MPKRLWWVAAYLVVFASSAPSTGPKIDHHQHLLSPQLAPLMETLERGDPKPVALPPAIADLLRRRTTAWNDAAALAPLYADQALLSQYGDSSLLIDDQTVVGRKAVSEHVAGRFARACGSTVRRPRPAARSPAGSAASARVGRARPGG